MEQICPSTWIGNWPVYYLLSASQLQTATADFIEDIHKTVPLKKGLILPVTYHGNMGFLDKVIQIKQFINCWMFT